MWESWFWSLRLFKYDPTAWVYASIKLKIPQKKNHRKITNGEGLIEIIKII